MSGPILATWVDHKGRMWPEVQSKRRLKFKYPLHAALRAFVHHRDGYKCLRCQTPAVGVPKDYDGRYGLITARVGPGGYSVSLEMDHIVTLMAGGTNAHTNLQTLCSECNRQKGNFEDRAAVHAFLSRREVACHA